jgi:ABC-type polysaccharide/polyol phosphate export permease
VIAQIAQLYRSRELLYMLVWRDIRVRYKQSIMGFLWAILLPSIIVIAGVGVRIAVSTYSGKGIQLAEIGDVMVRSCPWAFVLSALKFSTASLTSNTNLVTKVAFPKEVFPLSTTLTAFFDMMIAFVAVLVILAIAGVPVRPQALWALPLVLLVFALCLGLGLVLSAGNLFYRDVRYLVDAVLPFAIFFTPVLYTLADTGKWGKYIALNPVTPLLEGISGAIVFGTSPDPWWTLYSAAWALVLMVGGYVLFKRLEDDFAESI